jgi:hypothetical protein
MVPVVGLEPASAPAGSNGDILRQYGTIYLTAKSSATRIPIGLHLPL